MESERGWIRNLNSKLIDTGIATLIKNSSNGSEWLKEEIRRSDNRLTAAKSGLPLSKIVPKLDVSFYTPNLESYYKGPDRVLR